MAAASPSSATLTPNASYARLPSPPMSLYQENEELQQQEHQQQQRRDSVSPEPSNDQPSNQIQSPPLQFELHESFLHPPRPNHTHPHPPASSAHAIQTKPVSVFPLLSPIFSEGSPGLAEDREWMMSPSHSHADLHKAGNQRLEHELSPIGLGFHVSGKEEEEGGAVGGGGDGIMLGAFELDKLSEANGIINEPHQDSSYDTRTHGEKEEVTLASETVSVSDGSGNGEGETELVEMAQIRESDEKTIKVVEQSEQMEGGQLDNDRGLPLHLDEPHKDSTVSNCFQGDLAPPTAVVECPPSPGNGAGPGGGFVKTGLATPHMIRWEPAADDTQTQVTYRTSIQESSQSPQTDSHFLEDFID